MSERKSKTGYYVTAPDGGWGYIIVLVIAVTNTICVLPMVTFGIIFEPFLKSVGDETGSTALIIGICLAAQWFSGFAANILLQKMSYRKVGVIGAVLYFIGLLGTSFVVNLYQFILSFSLIQGFGFGLMLPSMLTAFNLYFNKKRTVAYNFAGVLTILISSSFPLFASYLMENFDFRGANLIQTAIGLNCIPAMLCLHPIKWHLKKRKISFCENNVELVEAKGTETEILNKQIPFASDNTEITSSKCSACPNFLTSTVKLLDLKLFTDPVYLNIAIGVSLCLTTDATFIPIFPLFFTNSNITPTEASIIITVFYVGDVIGRLILITVTSCMKVKNRNLMLLGAVLVAIFRTALVLNNSFWWLSVCSALLGSIRCLFLTTYPLIFSELYSKRFVTAFSLFMIVCGIMSISSGVLINIVKSEIQTNAVIAHFLTIMNLLCAVPWLLEYLYFIVVK